MRPVSSSYAMMGLASSLLEPGNREIKEQVLDLIKPEYDRISDWTNKSEVLNHIGSLCDALKGALEISESMQKPFLVQPIWRTKGQSLELCGQCFDVFVWSDISILGIPVIESTSERKIIRVQREVARHIRCLHDILTSKNYDYKGIYKGMDYGYQDR